MRVIRSFAVADGSVAAGGDPAATEAAVRALVHGARVIGVGEAAHSVREVQAVQDLIVRSLVREPGERIAAVALESGFAESLELEAWVCGEGTDDELAAVAERGMSYGFGASPQLQALLAWLREWNRAHPAQRVQVFGIDLPGSSTSPGPAVRVCLARVPRRAGDGTLQRLAELGGRTEAAIAYAGMSAAERAELVAGIRSLIERVAACGDPVAHRAAASLDAFLAELRFDPAAEPQAAPFPRERFMADTVQWIAKRCGRTIVLAHNAHLRRTPLHGRPALGTMLQRELGDAYRVIATAYASGPAVRFTQRSPRPFDCDVALEHREAQPGSIEAVIERFLPEEAPEAALLDLRALPGGDPALATAVTAATGIMAGGELDPVDDFPAAFDAIVHLRRAHPVAGAFERLAAEFGEGGGSGSGQHPDPHPDPHPAAEPQPAPTAAPEDRP